jgi:hypothetical protein
LKVEPASRSEKHKKSLKSRRVESFEGGKLFRDYVGDLSMRLGGELVETRLEEKASTAVLDEEQKKRLGYRQCRTSSKETKGKGKCADERTTTALKPASQDQTATICRRKGEERRNKTAPRRDQSILHFLDNRQGSMEQLRNKT